MAKSSGGTRVRSAAAARPMLGAPAARGGVTKSTLQSALSKTQVLAPRGEANAKGMYEVSREVKNIEVKSTKGNFVTANVDVVAKTKHKTFPNIEGKKNIKYEVVYDTKKKRWSEYRLMSDTHEWTKK